MFNKLKSTDADFSLINHDPFLDLMNKNILYLTHTIDKCLVLLKELKVNEDLQMQVDDVFNKKSITEDSKQAEEVVEEHGNRSDT